MTLISLTPVLRTGTTHLGCRDLVHSFEMSIIEVENPELCNKAPAKDYIKEPHREPDDL